MKLQYLGEVLSQVKDRKRNPAIITINMLSANPDYEKIKKNNFEQYYWEPLTSNL